MEKIIVVDLKKNNRELNINFYDFIKDQYESANRFIVCNVTNEEYENILEHNGDYVKDRYMMFFDLKNDCIKLANYQEKPKMGSYYIMDGNLWFDKMSYPFTVKMGEYNNILNNYVIYTTETYDDVINHYSNTNKPKEIPNMPLDDIIASIEKNPRDFYMAIAEQLSEEEREYIISLIARKSCQNCDNIPCREENMRQLNSNLCKSWKNGELVGKMKLVGYSHVIKSRYS